MLPNYSTLTCAFAHLPPTVRYLLAHFFIEGRDNLQRPGGEREEANAALMLLSDANRESRSRERAALKPVVNTQ